MPDPARSNEPATISIPPTTPVQIGNSSGPNSTAATPAVADLSSQDMASVADALASSVEKLSETFVRRDATYKDYIDNKPAPSAAIVNFKLKFKKEFSGYISGYFDESAISLLENGDLCVDVNFREDNWIAGWLLSFGDMVEVMEPVRYREMLKTYAGKILNIYQT